MSDLRSMDRRRFIRTLGATGIGASLAGCSSGGGGSGDRTIKMTLLSQTAEAVINGLEPALKEAGMADDITLEIDTATPGQLEDQYRQWLNAGRSTPDLLTMDVGWSVPFIRRNQLLNLNDHLTDDELNTLESEFNAASVDSSRGRDGSLYGVPFIFDVRGLLYRRDLAEKAGYDPDGESWGTEPRTWAEMSQIIADVKSQQNLDYGLTMPFELSQTITCCTFNAMMSQWGGAYFGGRENLFGPIGDRPVTVDEEPVLNALRMLRTFVHGHDDEHALGDEFAGNITPTEALGWRYTTDMESFLNGNAFAYTAGNAGFVRLGATQNYFGDAVNDKLGLMPYPYGVEQSESNYEGIGGPMSPLAGYNLSVNPNSSKIDTALEVIRTVLTDDFHRRFFELGGNPPPKTDLQTAEAVTGHETYGQYMDTMSIAADHAMPRPVTPIYFQESDIISQEVHNVVSQSKSPEKGMADLKSQLQEIEQNNAQ